MQPTPKSSGHDRIMSELLALKTKHAATVYELEQLKGEIRTLRSEQSTFIRQMENNNKLVDVLESDKQALALNLQVALETTTQLQSEKEVLNNEMIELKATHSTAKRDIASLNARIKQLQCGIELNKSEEKDSIAPSRDSKRHKQQDSSEDEVIEESTAPSRESKRAKRKNVSECHQNSTVSSRESKRLKRQDSSEHENHYEVAKLLNHKYENKKRYFFVRWKSCGSSADSWVVEEDLECPRLLKAYLKKNKMA